MSNWIVLTDDGERMTCKMPADESVVEVRLKAGTVRRAFACYYDGWDFVPVDEEDEPTDGESLRDEIEAWRYPLTALSADTQPQEPGT